jgi:hypothetical protein
MDPLTPTTSTLAPAISHIAETATSLSRELAAHVPAKTELRRPQERQTVQWVLDAPERLEQLLLDDQKDEAREEWAMVENLLDKWQGVEGVEAVRLACEKVLSDVDD